MTLGFDLAPERAAVEEFFVDRCRVLRDAEGVLDDEVNPDTLETVNADAGKDVVYQGPCLAGKAQREERDAEGEQTVFRRVLRPRFPIGTGPYWTGDVVVMEASPDPRSNPDLIDQRFRIFDPNDRSLASSIIVLAEDETGTRAR